MVLQPPRTPGTDAFMRIYNTDGSESGACGNGTRCVAWHLMPILGTDGLTLETRTSLVLASRAGDDMFTVDMGPPRFDWQDIPLAEEFRDTRYIELQIGPIDAPVLHSPSAVSMGNPHAVFWVDQDPADYDLARIGPLLENHPIFPERANISLAQILGRDHIRARVWERGAGLTLACGSAACAIAVAAARLKRTERQVVVSACPAAISASTGARRRPRADDRRRSPSSMRACSTPPGSRLRPERRRDWPTSSPSAAA